MNSSDVDLSTILNRIIDKIADNLRIAKILINSASILTTSHLARSSIVFWKSYSPT